MVRLQCNCYAVFLEQHTGNCGVSLHNCSWEMSCLLSQPILNEDIHPWILGHALEHLDSSTRLEIGRKRALLPCMYGIGRPRRWKLSTWGRAAVQTESTSASDSQGGSLVYLLEATDGILSMLSHLFWVLELCNEWGFWWAAPWLLASAHH